VVQNWWQPFVKRVSLPENVGRDGSWSDWDIKMAGEFTRSVRLRIVARFLMHCLLHYQELHPRVNFICIFCAFCGNQFSAK
jgi:hypothetical protein